MGPSISGADESHVELARRSAAVRRGVEVVRHPEMGGVPGGAHVDADPRDEVIDRAVGRVDGDADHRAPTGAVGRGTDHDVVRWAPTAEAAVLPHGVHLPRAVDLRRHKGAGAQVAGDAVVGDARDGEGTGVGHPSVR